MRQKPRPSGCIYCGDETGSLCNVPEGYACKECAQEVLYGKIGKQEPLNEYGGGRATVDDESPWQQIAIREMEDRG